MPAVLISWKADMILSLIHISKSRTKQISNARHIAVYICRKHLQVPFVKIGLSFGNRDHSTIMSSYEKAKKMIKQDPLFKTAVEQIETKLGIH